MVAKSVALLALLPLTPALGGPAAAAEGCTSGCHADVLEGAVRHAAVEAGCDLCHEAAEGEDHAFRLAAGSIVELCCTCHDEVAARLEAAHVHGAVANPGCTGCHDPHAAAYPRLLRAAGNELCEACHLAGEAESDDDGRVTLFGGQRVDREYLAGVPRIALFAGATGHPNRRHPVKGVADPSREGHELGCVSCHEPHGSDHRALQIGGAGMRTCTRCHGN